MICPVNKQFKIYGRICPEKIRRNYGLYPNRFFDIMDFMKCNH